MTATFDIAFPLPGARFGATARLRGGGDAGAVVAAAEAEPGALPAALADANGLLLLRDLHAIADDPALLTTQLAPPMDLIARDMTLRWGRGSSQPICPSGNPASPLMACCDKEEERA